MGLQDVFVGGIPLIPFIGLVIIILCVVGVFVCACIDKVRQAKMEARRAQAAAAASRNPGIFANQMYYPNQGPGGYGYYPNQGSPVNYQNEGPLANYQNQGPPADNAGSMQPLPMAPTAAGPTQLQNPDQNAQKSSATSGTSYPKQKY